MKTLMSVYNFSHKAKQVGTPSYWFATEIINDRQPEGTRVREGAGYA